VDAVEPALAQLNENGGNWQWQVVGDEDVAAAGMLSSGQAGVAVVEGNEGIVVQQRPLALAVPFTAEWENATPAEVESILNDGHELAQVVPWEAMPPTHKALRIDGRLPADPGYALQESWSLAAAPGYEAAAAELAPVLQTIIAPETVIHLAAVGDIMLDRTLGAVLQQGKLDHPFAFVADGLRAADITVGNLESALGDVGQPAAKSYTFRAPPAAAEALALAGFDVMSLANNHGMDYGPEALLQGLGLLREQAIGTIGAGANAAEARAPYIAEVKGLTLAFLGYVHVPVEARSHFDTASWTATAGTPGLAWGDPEAIAADVTAVRPQADVVIVVLHSAYEYVEAPSPPQVAAAKAAIDAGADLVIGHHAHILQGVEFYNGGVIVYGLGNFAFVIDGPPETAILNVWLDKDGVRQLEIVPAVIQSGGQPRLAEPWEAAAIRRRVYQLSRLLGAP
jgi:poly-gamma-glutamate synthesis protein (capsule biosynthesis protein)